MSYFVIQKINAKLKLFCKSPNFVLKLYPSLTITTKIIITADLTNSPSLILDYCINITKT